MVKRLEGPAQSAQPSVYANRRKPLYIWLPDQPRTWKNGLVDLITNCFIDANIASTHLLLLWTGNCNNWINQKSITLTKL